MVAPAQVSQQIVETVINSLFTLMRERIVKDRCSVKADLEI